MIARRIPFCLAAITLALAVTGCSTWRCRGFLNTMEEPRSASRDDYVLTRVEFRKLAAREVSVRESAPWLAWASGQDALIGTSYLDDISKASGLTNVVADAVNVSVSIVPVAERKDGEWSIAWPLLCTLGVFPCHLEQVIPFDVIVRFDSKVKSRPDIPPQSYATAVMGLIRVDRQYGLTRMDMDPPPAAQSASAEVRDDGTVGTGRELRSERMRNAFVETVADAINYAISVREGGARAQTAQPATEFGPIVFPFPDLDEREATPGWGMSPEVKVPNPKTVEQFLDECWNHPKTEHEIMLKRAVDSGILKREDWERQMREIWKKREGK